MKAALSDWVGRTRQCGDRVTERLVESYKATLAPHLLLPPDPDETPPGLHWCLANPMPAAVDLAEDGSEGNGAFLPPAPLPRRMWAGGVVETLAPVRIDAAVHRRSAILDIHERAGHSGRLCFITIEHLISADGAVAVREKQKLVFREAVAIADPRPSARPDGDLIWRIDASPVLLFRFSALTFNSHRIHYDHPFALQEGYKGLLVHGPLQANLLLNQAAQLLGRVPRLFSYRCVAPLIAGGQFDVLTAHSPGGAAKGTIVDAGGVITTECKAEFSVMP